MSSFFENFNRNNRDNRGALRGQHAIEAKMAPVRKSHLVVHPLNKMQSMPTSEMPHDFDHCKYVGLTTDQIPRNLPAAERRAALVGRVEWTRHAGDVSVQFEQTVTLADLKGLYNDLQKTDPGRAQKV